MLVFCWLQEGFEQFYDVLEVRDDLFLSSISWKTNLIQVDVEIRLIFWLFVKMVTGKITEQSSYVFQIHVFSKKNCDTPFVTGFMTF